MTINWTEKFHLVCESYKQTFRTNEENWDDAAEFERIREEFEGGGGSALEVLAQNLAGSDRFRKNVAARLLVQFQALEATEIVVSALRNAHVEFSTVALIGRFFVLPNALWETLWELTKTTPYYEDILIKVLLRFPTKKALDLVKRLIDEPNENTIHGALQALEKWEDKSWLYQFMTSKPTLTDQYMPSTIDLDAAFYLGLNDEPDGIDFLIDVAQNPDLRRAASAALRLAWLARPEAINPINSLLKSGNEVAVNFAMQAASVLGVPALGEGLLNAATLPTEISDLSGEVPLADEALRTLYWITGRPLPSEDYLIQARMEFTQDTRRNGIEFYRNELQSLTTNSRYHLGELLTLKHLSADLLSPHSNPVGKAAYNLRAITGMDFGFQTDYDVIANAKAIQKWQARSEHDTLMTPGGWAFAGVPLTYPRV